MRSKAAWLFLATLAVAFFLIWNIAYAATYTYTATSGSNNWATSAKWTSSTIPGSSDDAVVQAALGDTIFTIDSNTGAAASVSTLTFNGLQGAGNSSSYNQLAIPVTVSNGATFNHRAKNASTLTGNATFNASSTNASTGVITGNATFNGTSNQGISKSRNEGTINGDATFNGTSQNAANGTVTGNATFNDNSENTNAATIGGNAVFNDDSYPASNGIITGNVTLNTVHFGVAPTGGVLTIAAPAYGWEARIQGTLYGSDAQAITQFIFDTDAFNQGQIDADVTFNSNSSNESVYTITGDVTFNDDSSNSGTEIIGNVSFYDNSLVYSGSTITRNATFYENLTEDEGATITGTKTRHYTADATVTRNFLTDNTDVVVADGAGTVVDISGATYDGTITFTCLNGGTFSPDPGCTGGGTAPTVTTQAASSVSETSATVNGNITSTGSASVTVRGFAYGTGATLTTVIATTTDTAGQPFSTGAFTGTLSSLACNTTYYARAYATNSVGTALGSIQSFTTSACASSGGGESTGGGFSTPSKKPKAPLVTTPPTPVCFVFLTDLEHGMTSKAVRKLQQFLNAHGYTISPSGVGSLGNETYYFGRATERALARFQEAYATELLAPEGLTKGNGKLKSKTRKKTNQAFVNACAQTGTPIPSVSDPLVPLPEEDLPAEVPPHQSLGWFIDDTETNRPPTENLTPSPSTEEVPTEGDQPVSGGPVLDTGEVIDESTPTTPTPDAPLLPGSADEPVPPTPDTKGRDAESPAPENILLGVVPMLQGILGTSTQSLRVGSQLVAIALAPVADLIAPIGLAISLGALAGTVVPITGIPQSADIAVSLKRFWDLLLATLNIRRRRPWGVVYDSVTKRPLDPATITLTDAFGKKVGSSFTDLDGRYGFVVPPGTYRLEVTKANYIFPSQKLSNRTSDEVYPSLYFGGEITIRDNGTIVNNIPLDPVGLDWKEIAAQNTKQYHYYSGRARAFAFLSVWLFRIGFLLAVYTVMKSQTAYDLAVLGVYVLVGILRILGFGPRPYGTLTEHGTHNPLAFALVRVQEAITGEEVVRTVADNLGRYYALVENGRYVVEVEKKEANASYTRAYVSPVLTVKRGVINKSLVI